MTRSAICRFLFPFSFDMEGKTPVSYPPFLSPCAGQKLDTRHWPPPLSFKVEVLLP